MGTFGLRVLATLALLTAQSGCDGMVGSDYRGEPLLTVTGTINYYSGQTPSETTLGEVRISVFWSPSHGGNLGRRNACRFLNSALSGMPVKGG